MWLAVALLLACFCCTSSARADAPRVRGNAFDRAPLLYGFGDIGFGVPLGVAGVGMGISPSELFALELGVGTNAFGLQLSAMASLRGRVDPRVTLGISAGASLGPTANTEPSISHAFDAYVPSYIKRWSSVLWMNLELQVRWSVSKELVLRPHVGLGAPLAHGVGDCRIYSNEVDPKEAEAACGANSLSVAPYIGFAIELVPLR